MDHAQGNNDRIFFRFLRNTSDQTTPVSFPGATSVADPRGENRDFAFGNYGGGWIHTLSPTILNEFRYLYLKQTNDMRAIGADSGVAGKIGLKGVNPDHFPRMTVTGLIKFGINRDVTLQDRQTHEISDNVTIVRGKHQIRAGFNFRHSSHGVDTLTASSGLFAFNNRATKEGLAAFLLGWTNSATLLSSDLVTFADYWAGFVGDDWKITPNFTLNLGLRWEMDTPPTREGDKMAGFDPVPINPVSGNPGIVTFAPFTDTGRKPFYHDKNNWSPRFGFAYRPSRNWVVRGGYGIFYSKPWRVANASADMGFAERADFSSPDGGFTPAFLLKDGMPPPPPSETLGPGFGAVPVGQAPQLALTYWDTHQRSPYNQQWNLAIQRMLPAEIALEASYIGNVGHKLFGNNLLINMIPLVDGKGPAKQDQKLRPFPQYNNITLLSASLGNSAYHAMNLKFEKRYSRGLSFLTNYTWSKFLDDISGQSELGSVPTAGYTHLELRSLDRSLSGNHIAHRYIGSLVFDLPWGRGSAISNPVLNLVAGGWTLAPILELRTGPTFGVVEQTNRSNTYSHGQRPNLLGDPALAGDRSRSDQITEWFDTSAFEEPGVGLNGNAPRTVCCGPGFVGVDLSMQKRFRFNERVHLQFRADFFNLPNRPNFGLPAVLRGRADFGRISSTVGTARQTQFGLRLEF